MCLGVPGKIVAVHGNDGVERSAQVDFAGVRREVSLACLPEAQVGDYVMVHVGFAISRINEKAAAESLHLLRELEEKLGESS